MNLLGTMQSQHFFSGKQVRSEAAAFLLALLGRSPRGAGSVNFERSGHLKKEIISHRNFATWGRSVPARHFWIFRGCFNGASFTGLWQVQRMQGFMYEGLAMELGAGAYRCACLQR